jgi:hypothetical protein
MFRHLFFAVCCALPMGPFWSALETAGVLANLDRLKSEIHADRCSQNPDTNCLAGVCMPGCPQE